MVVATIGLLIIAYKSSSVSIEIANTKIELSSVITKTKEIRNELQIEDERLKQANKELQEKLKAPKLNEATSKIMLEELKKSGQRIEMSKERFKDLDAKIQSAEKAIKKY
ncbi:MAG: hypothetical protein L6246_01835 [Thermodesulfovibrionales bacterium]|nr:hypothetical protein [Thermodesulfovibrionales bacterium]